jgi:hypothetical protein
MKSRAGVHIGLAAALCGILPSLKGGYLIALIVVIVILGLSALILYLHDRVSCAFWQRLVRIADDMGIGHTASGFGFVGVGLSLIKPGWWLLGIMLALTGAFLLGAGVGTNLGIFLKRVLVKVRKK